MPIAPSTYYAHKACDFVSQADWDDAHLADQLFDIWSANRRLYGAEKLWTAALDDGLQVGRDQVSRLMKILGIEGVRRGCEQLPAVHLNATERVYACANEARPVGSFVRRPPEHRLPLVL